MIILFSILWGSLLALFLCSPFSYYPLFIATTIISLGILIISRKLCFSKKLWIYPIATAIFFLSYFICSYTIFKSNNISFINSQKTNLNKEAVIFYCEGEMEKYTPYYANYFFNEKPYFIKPFYANKLKYAYSKLGINTKNQTLLEISSEVKASLLNYKPYFYYTCFAGYSPDIIDSINAALSDGCSKITIINYTSNPNLEKMLNTTLPISSLLKKNISIQFTPSVCSSTSFIKSYSSKLKDLYSSYDAIIILDNPCATGNEIKSFLEKGDSTKIIVSTNLEESINSCYQKGQKKILLVNTLDSSSGINSRVIIPELLNKYSEDMKITTLNDWGNSKFLVQASIETFRKTIEK